MAKYLEIKNISKTFISHKKSLIALEKINFSVNKGDFVCIVGKSGCGKTTLLRIMAGLEHATSGKVICNEKKVISPNKKNIFIFQDFNQLFPRKTVKQNILYPIQLNNIETFKKNYKIFEEKAKQYLHLVELEDFEDYYPHKLSGGMRQRVAIARALATEPEIIYMDEPFSSLDAQTREKLQNSLLSIWKKLKITIVFITHNIDEAIKLSNKIVVLGKKPTKVVDVIKNNVTGKREPIDIEYLELWNELHKSIIEDSED